MNALTPADTLTTSNAPTTPSRLTTAPTLAPANALTTPNALTTAATLATQKKGQWTRVVSVGGPRSFRRRLLEMGFVAGTAVRVVGVAPMGDPMELELRGGRVSIRHAEARAVQVAL